MINDLRSSITTRNILPKRILLCPLFILINKLQRGDLLSGILNLQLLFFTIYIRTLCNISITCVAPPSIKPHIMCFFSFWKLLLGPGLARQLFVLKYANKFSRRRRFGTGEYGSAFLRRFFLPEVGRFACSL